MDRLTKSQGVAVDVSHIEAANAPDLIHRSLMDRRILMPHDIEPAVKTSLEKIVHILHSNIDGTSERSVAWVLRELDLCVSLHQMDHPIGIARFRVFLLKTQNAGVKRRRPLCGAAPNDRDRPRRFTVCCGDKTIGRISVVERRSHYDEWIRCTL